MCQALGIFSAQNRKPCSQEAYVLDEDVAQVIQRHLASEKFKPHTALKTKQKVLMCRFYIDKTV
jgi:hypothetical protein